MLHTMVLLFGCGQLVVPSAPKRPNFAELVPPRSDGMIVTPDQIVRHAQINEATAFVSWFDKMWFRFVDDTATQQDYSDCLTALAQFDAVLTTLTPQPTLTESFARVRAYRHFVALIRSKVERMTAAGLTPPVTLEFVDEKFAFILKEYVAVFRRSG